MVVGNIHIQIVLIALINFFAAFLQASSGFGYSIVSMSLMPLILPMRYCSAISAVTVVSIGLQMVIILREHINFRLVLVPILSSFATIYLGVYLVMSLSDRLLRFILSSLILVLTIFFFYTQQSQFKVKRTTGNSVLAGLVTGLSTGMFNIAGPFLLVYYISVADSMLIFKACMEFSFLIVGLYSTGLHLVYGNISYTTMPFILVSVLSALLAGFLGIKLFKRFDKQKISVFIYCLLPLLATLLIIK